jgi:hypothetical protein
VVVDRRVLRAAAAIGGVVCVYAAGASLIDLTGEFTGIRIETRRYEERRARRRGKHGLWGDDI